MAAYTIEGLSFYYPGSSNPALRDLNLAIPRGQFLLLSGASGSGKTTLLRHLKGVLSPHGLLQGQVCFEGRPLDQVGFREQSSSIGFVMQNPDQQVVTDQVWHELAFGLESLGLNSTAIRVRVAETASFFGIEPWFHRDVSHLSGGQKQLLNLASVMAMQPSVLLLDEPTSQLDPIAAANFINAVRRINRELGVTVVISEHRLEEALPAADRVLVLEQGSLIADGRPDEAGMILKNRRHYMFQAWPVPMQVYARVENSLDCPVTVREGRIWLDRMHEQGRLDTSLPDSHPSEPTTGPGPAVPPLIEFRSVWFKYQRETEYVLKDFSLSITAGGFYTLNGGNGAGKSTALSLLAGINRPHRGRVLIGGVEISKIPGEKLFNGMLGCLPQDPRALFVKSTVAADLREILVGRGLNLAESEQRWEKALSICRLHSLLDRHPYDLSLGEQQRAALAKVLLLEPQILLLDEPTRGLDADSKLQLANILQELIKRGATILMVSHDIEFCARHASRCGLLFDGSITSEGEPAAFFAGNGFYTTSASRMARHLLPHAVTADDVVQALGAKPRNEDPGDVLPMTSPGPLFLDRLSGKAPLKTASGGSNAGTGLGLKLQARLVPTAWRGLGRRLPSRTTLTALLMMLAAVPLTIWLGMELLDDRKYYFISMLVIMETMLPLAMIFEKRRPMARELVIIAVLCALGVAGRAAFFMLPQIKPVIAIVVIAGVCLGVEAGFLVGAATAFLSDCFFGQGPWTPWQMLSLGIIGFMAGLVFKKGLLPRHRLPLCAFGALTALIVYGGLMNPAAVVIFQPRPTAEMFWLAYIQGLPFDLAHAGATAVFLYIIAIPMIEKLERIQAKYGLIEP